MHLSTEIKCSLQGPREERNAFKNASIVKIVLLITF